MVRDNHVVYDLWCINPWLTSHMIGAAHGQRIDAAEQERGRATFAELSERAAVLAARDLSGSERAFVDAVAANVASARRLP